MDFATATSLWSYKDGNLYWKKDGKIAGYLHKSGYEYVHLKEKTYRVHRIIFLICTGYLPCAIDHINGNKEDNRIENLRPANNTQNQHNTTKRKTNKSGYKNIFWEKARGKWRVEFRIGNGKSKVVGRFINLDDAIKAANEKTIFYHGDFACKR